jgi:tetratricopeptide (TPR) repeat protein
MARSLRPLLLCLSCTLAVGPIAAWADPPETPKTAPAPGPKADRAAEFAIPGEDPPQAFVPSRPMTVEDRKRIEALTDYSAARALEDQNAWSDAIAVLEKALKVEPESVAVLRRLSRLCFVVRRPEQALDYGKRALEADPDDPDTISRIVSHFTQKGDAAGAEQAVSVLNAVLANPKLEAHAAGRLFADFELGSLYALRLRQPGKAAEALARVLDALDEKSANRLSPRDQRRVLGDDPAESYLEFGRVFLQAGRDELAVKAFERGLVYNPDHPELPLRLADTLLKLGKGEEALGLVERFLKRQPQGAEGYELLAKVLTALKRGNEITPRLEQAAKADSKNLTLQYALADRYRETGQTEKAEELYKSLLAAQPTPQGYRALAASLLKRKRTDDLLRVLVQVFNKPGWLEAVAPQLEAIVKDREYAYEVIDRGVKLLSSDPPAIDKSGIRVLHLLSGSLVKSVEDSGADADRALSKFADVSRLAVKLVPSPQTFHELSITLYRLGKLDEAAKTMEQLVDRYPEEKNARRLIVLGEFRRAADQKDGAISAFREALKLDPNDVAAQYNLALTLSQTGKTDEAVSVLKTSLKNDPPNPELNRALGYVLSQHGKNEEAIAHYKGLLERYPNNEELYKVARSGLSVVYVNQGDYAKGEAELEALLQREPDEPGVNNDLGYLYADQGKNLEKAESMIRKALQGEPESPAYLDSLGWVLFKRGKVKEAIEPLEKAVKKGQPGTTDATILEHLGDVYFRLQNYEKAKDAWVEAEKSGAKAVPPDRRLQEIRKKLKSLEQLGSAPKLSAGKTP